MSISNFGGLVFILVLFFPLIIGIIVGIYNSTERVISKKARKEINTRIEKKQEEIIQLATKNAEMAIQKLKDESLILTRQRDSLMQMREQLSHSLSQEYPYLSESIAQQQYLQDIEKAKVLLLKRHSAKKASEDVREISAKKRELSLQCESYKNQLAFYEYLFPWLEDFRELPPADAINYVFETRDNEEYGKWLSPEEYKILSSAEKSQLALERWIKKPKSKWEIGINYERYIGYLKEKDGFDIVFNGALHGLEDMGIDLIATKVNDIQVIQCKRWSEYKTIREKYIFQLYGTMVLKELEFPQKRISGILIVAENNISDLACQCAKKLKIKIQTIPSKQYPLIKCNINKGNKIYHLPFDQQYDRTKIDFSKGEFYAQTAKEAENAGFRHAFKHINY